MKALQVIEEIPNRVFKWHSFPVGLKVEYVDERGFPVFIHLSRRRNSWTAQLVLYNTKATGCTTDKGPWHVSAVEKLSMKWGHETFEKMVSFLHSPIYHVQN